MPHIVGGTLTGRSSRREAKKEEGERTESVKGPIMSYLQASELLLGKHFNHRTEFFAS